MHRRRFLSGALGVSVSAGVSTSSVAGPDTSTAALGASPRIRRYVRLGRTDLEIADVSFGGSRLRDPALVRHAFERGVNYFDTAESYRGGDSEEAVGKALEGVRHDVVIASKTKAWSNDRAVDMMRSLEASLRRLRTDYVDIFYNHAVNDVGRMANAEWHEFTERAREQGKIRYRGMSGHGGRLVDALDYALEHELVDVVLAAFNFAQDPDFYDKLRSVFHFVALQPDLPPMLERAREQGVGVIAMKTLMGARINDMRRYESDGATFAQAAFRWVFASGKADALVVSMTSKEDIDEYVAASGTHAVAAQDMRMLARYAALQVPRYCQQGCNRCDSACPNGVEIPEVLRTRMYEVDYGDGELARQDYGALARDATACVGCVEQPCLGACPNGLPIAALARDAALRFG